MPLGGDTRDRGAARLAEQGIGEVKGGSLYPALTKLENEGLVTSLWRAGDGGPNRKYCRTTEAGMAYLAQESAGWQALAASAADLMGLPDQARH
jgi:PadR family transcriptional regulator PadR